MPQASAGAAKKYAYLDHDSDHLQQTDPVPNSWYEVFHAYDVRLIWCVVLQHNDDSAAKNLEVRWTIDGTEYFVALSATDSAPYWIYRDYLDSNAGSQGLTSSTTFENAAHSVDKRGQDFKVEVRQTSNASNPAMLQCWCVRETLEVT
jgi:hypothetical protein